MVSKLMFLYFLLGIVYMTNAQKNGEEVIPWSEERRLSWSDFKGEVPRDAMAAATTASGISYKYSANLMFNEVNLDFEVNTYFYPDGSWYKPDICDSTVLAHEQLHFDITELFARKMRKRLRQSTFSDNVKAEVRDIYNTILAELNAFQERYDWETDFSRKHEAQKRWKERVWAQLAVYEPEK
ncbi:DUF922 domain-containing protein [Croceivirga thetidis]|uniref:DUF922 domain-containing Zn-dependent protease n=1 Tax=Croceivirga thetidis TaxID=2721623 RepID=A0ABX1GPM2_9FLAO|nr:DUF922 domain-containing protein [Croceivirga thetidis]NKI31865.1 DUF922 domain-containing Zn-dependent protease [Croceivirga thetidis]